MTLADIITPEELASLISEDECRAKRGEGLRKEQIELLVPYIREAVRQISREHVAGMVHGFALIERNLRRKAVPIEVIR